MSPSRPLHHLSPWLWVLVALSALRAPQVSPLAIPHGGGTHEQEYPQKHASEPGRDSSLLPATLRQEYPQKHASEPGKDSAQLLPATRRQDIYPQKQAPQPGGKAPQPGGKESLFDGTHGEEYFGEKDAQIRAEQHKGPIQRHRKAPLFMVDLFNTVQQAGGPWGPPRQAGGLRRGSLRAPWTPRSQKDLLKGNIVRSLQDKGPGRFHFFNLSSVGREEKVIKAEFRWFRTKQRSHPKNLHFYKVDLYEVEGGGALPWRGKLISSRLLPLHSQGWEVFNVTLTVSTWLHNNQENNGFLLVSSLHSATPPERAPQNSLHSATPPERAPENRNAYLVLFSDDTPTAEHESGGSGGSRGDSVVVPSPATRRRRSAADPWPRPQPCRRAPLFVDFEEIGWGGWIISPRGYNAYSCEGACPFPLGENLRATNHATVRSIMHALKLTPRGDDGGAPCCVPDKLQAISLLYFDEDENVVLKQYDDMVALSCGCQ